MMMATFDKIDDKRKAHWYYHPWFLELLQLFWLDAAGAQPQNFAMYEGIIDDYNHFLDAHPRPEKPLLSGDEVMEILDLEPGEKVGEILQQLSDAQLKEEVTLKKEAIAFLESLGNVDNFLG
jgi:tRNA nucleotidyltransferase/poly(A) polymerase